MVNKRWYRALKKSRLTPPDYVFSIVWPVLYTLLGIACYLMVSAAEHTILCRPLVLFSLQMMLNLVWSTLFFRYKMIRTGLLSIGLIIALTLLTYHDLLSVNRWAAYLLLPYLLWLSLASYLNAYIVWYN